MLFLFSVSVSLFSSLDLLVGKKALSLVEGGEGEELPMLELHKPVKVRYASGIGYLAQESTKEVPTCSYYIEPGCFSCYLSNILCFRPSLD